MGLFARFSKSKKGEEEATDTTPETGDAPKPAEPDKAFPFSENPEQLLAGKSPHFLQELIDKLPDAVYIKDLNSRFIMANTTLAAGIYSLNDPAKTIGRTDFDFLPQELARRFYEDEQKIISTGKPLLGVEEKQILPDGRVTWFLTSKFPLKDATGRAMGTWGMSRDITKQKRAEEELNASEERLRHAQKMEAFGQLAGGIAHDFNNMLGIILGSAQLIEIKGGNPEVKENISMVIDTAKRAADLTQQLLAFARKGNYKVVPLELHEVVRSVIGLLKHTIDRRIRIVERLNAPFSTIKGDYVQLQNALLNLAINARDAMPQGGTLTFSTEVVGPGATLPGAVRGAADFGSYLLVKVTDSGTGMDEKTKRRAFEPFFTTKEPGKGTGLGLASVYGTIKSLNGLIEFESELKKGTTFSIFLPLIVATEAKRAEEPAAAKKGSGTILVVDDEEDLRFIAGEILKTLGYAVVTCKDGLEAVEYYTVHHAEIDVAIVDIVMPRMGGYDCISKLKKINPAVRVLISSGYCLSTDTQMIITTGIAGVIQKPFRIEELSQTLSNVFAGNNRR
jgi:PAS domain S-box-containing protein